jgi:hypothetical protein
MTLSSTVPVTVTAEAAARIAELGLRAELEQMIEHALTTLTAVRKLEVVLDPPYDLGDEPLITLEVVRDAAVHAPGDPDLRTWGRWKAATFSPDVSRHFGLLIAYVPEHAR